MAVQVRPSFAAFNLLSGGILTTALPSSAWALEPTHVSFLPVVDFALVGLIVLALCTGLIIHIRTRRALIRERALKGMILDTTRELIVYYGADQRVVWANQTAGRSVHLSPEELRGRLCHEIWHQRKLPCSGCPVILCRQTRKPEESEIRSPDGRVWLIHGYPVFDKEGEVCGVVEVCADITARVQAEEACRESEARYRGLVDHCPIGMYRSSGGTGRYLQVNPAVVQMFGFDSAEELQKVPITDLYRDPADRIGLLRELIRQGSVRRHELPMKRKDGTPIWCAVYATAQHNEDGSFKYMEGVLEDITELKRTEERLEQAYRELESFAHTVSHDLKSPLTAILGFSEVLLDIAADKLDETERECLQNIHTQGERMLALMDDLLTLASVGALKPPEKPSNLHAVLVDTLSQLDLRSFPPGVKNSLPREMTFRIAPTQLSQIFLNLIGNALRYAAEATQTIEVGAARSEQSLQLWVQDHGPGLPEHEKEKVFEAFYRGSTGKDKTGTGIGLSTVQKIADLFQGRAWIEQTPGGGCTVRVELREPGSDS